MLYIGATCHVQVLALFHNAQILTYNHSNQIDMPQ